jgi:toxin ParE1/3/4
MPRCKVEILTPAFNDIYAIADYHLMMVGPRSAEKTTDELLDTIKILEEHPFAGAQPPDHILKKHGYRKILCGNYVCVYKVIDEHVYIYRVVH